MLSAEHISLSYSGKQVLDDISFSVEKGDVIGIIGPSGVGKSRLLRVLVALDKPDSGSVIFDGEDITLPEADLGKARPKMGFVFQELNLFDHMTVLANVTCGPIDIKKEDRDAAVRRATELLRSLGLAGYADRYPERLSGGQKQRVAIARALSMEPELLIMDEPTSGLDPVMRKEIETVVKRLVESGSTMVIVSHQTDFLQSVCNKIIFIDNGKICETGTPEKIFGNPENEATRRFVRPLAELDFRIESKDFDFIGASTEVRDFAERSGMPDTLKNNLLSVFEELFEMLIMSKPDGEHLDITAEYDPNAKTIRLTARFTGERFDPESDESMVPWRIIGLRTKSASVSYCPGEYPNIITAEI